MSVAPRVGLLALQGGFAAHGRTLRALDVEPVEVRRPAELDGLDGLVIPGGESTTLIKLMAFEPSWWQALPAFVGRGGVVFGTCAGLILLSHRVEPEQDSLALLDVTVARNAWGRQVDSFEAEGRWGDGRSLPMIFIRAPRIVEVGETVDVLATYRDEPVLVASDNVLAATFHPELTHDLAVHDAFLERVRSAGG
ncbi:MAG: pyridoxal 5'-phosphate synthase glutaminase subunit PdxT [Acidobacteriota bacterium]